MRRAAAALCLTFGACATAELRSVCGTTNTVTCLLNANGLSSVQELRTRGAVLQRHEYSCGAAALATLMGRFGTKAEEVEVLKRVFGENLPKTRDAKGAELLPALTMADLEKGAREYGFKVVSLQVKRTEDLERVLDALQPVIARMTLYSEYHHFVVIHRLDEDWAWISDPAYGHVKLPKSQLFSAWESGERILLAISRVPFEAWKTREDRIYLRRQPKEPGLDAAPSPAPGELYESVHQRMSRLSTLP